ncbi:MAG: hypothetical protein QXQ48_08765 [Nitrososphaerota archaeon]
MPVFRGWYSQNGWKTKLVFINQHDQPAILRVKLFEGEDGRLLASFKLKLKPKDTRFYELSRIARVNGRAGLILIDSDKPIFCGGHIVSLEDETKIIDYRMPKVEEPPSCC